MTKSVFTEKYRRFMSMLVEARKNAEITQTDLSFKLSKPQSFVSKYENGERRLDLIEFLEIAEALEIDPVDFVCRLIASPKKGK